MYDMHVKLLPIAIENTTANFDKIEYNYQKLSSSKGMSQCIEPYGNLYTDTHQILSSIRKALTKDASMRAQNICFY